MSVTGVTSASADPKVSIGVPVYNGAATIVRTLDSLLEQSFCDFELIISDNGSTDHTAEICEAYAAKDARVRYIRQPHNLGPAANFRFLVDAAQAPYFLWAACDDIRTPDFLEENIRFLESHPDYVASTSPSCFEGQPQSEWVTFSLVGTVEERFRQFFDHCWKSHAIFYSVVRTNVLKRCEVLGTSFIAVDWAVDLFLASHGNIHRTEKGLTVFGLGGVSSRVGAYRYFRNRPLELVLPFYRLSRYVLGLSTHFQLKARIGIWKTLAGLNLKADYDQALSALYQFYCTYLRSWVRRTNTGS
ncbi:MAG: glycosyltransferase family 2 protein [Thiobacillus sp.]|nr:glycosyltransferase family 2 protein [Thiobacillus sp.]